MHHRCMNSLLHPVQPQSPAYRRMHMDVFSHHGPHSQSMAVSPPPRRNKQQATPAALKEDSPSFRTAVPRESALRALCKRVRSRRSSLPHPCQRPRWFPPSEASARILAVRLLRKPCPLFPHLPATLLPSPPYLTVLRACSRELSRPIPAPAHQRSHTCLDVYLGRCYSGGMRLGKFEAWWKVSTDTQVASKKFLDHVIYQVRNTNVEYVHFPPLP